jgi:hypothetical protein
LPPALVNSVVALPPNTRVREFQRDGRTILIGILSGRVKGIRCDVRVKWRIANAGLNSIGRIAPALDGGSRP